MLHNANIAEVWVIASLGHHVSHLLHRVFAMNVILQNSLPIVAASNHWKKQTVAKRWLLEDKKVVAYKVFNHNPVLDFKKNQMKLERNNCLVNGRWKKIDFGKFSSFLALFNYSGFQIQLPARRSWLLCTLMSHEQMVISASEKAMSCTCWIRGLFCLIHRTVIKFLLFALGFIDFIFGHFTQIIILATQIGGT